MCNFWIEKTVISKFALRVQLKTALLCGFTMLVAPSVSATAAEKAPILAIKDRAGNAQYTMVMPADHPGKVDGERCMPETSLCFAFTKGEETGWPAIRIRKNNPEGNAHAYTATTLTLDVGTEIDETVSLWPVGFRRIVRDERDSHGEAVIIGVITTYKDDYGDGYNKAENKTLWLYEIINAGTEKTNTVVRQILSVPFGAQRTNSGCVDENEKERRFGMCTNELLISASLWLDKANKEPKPRFMYQIATETQPSDLPLRSPEELMRPIKKSEMGKRKHPTCSYTKTLVWNPATVRYEFDTPAPECAIFGLER